MLRRAMSTSKTKFNVTVFSDNVCPWCFVGKRNLEKGMKDYIAEHSNQQQEDFNVEWKPFFLDLESPESSDVPIREYLNRKYGEGAGTRMSRALAQAGERCGIDFNNDRVVHNTVKSHRLLMRAKDQGKQDEMIEAIFHAYFEEGRNIADPSVLVDIANKVGVECSKEYFESSQDKLEVLKEFESGVRKHQIRGVPFYVITQEGSRQSIKLSGGQPPETFTEAFEALAGLS